jgi:hypothetical protein
MDYTRLLCAIGLGLSTAVLTANQAAPTGPLPAEVRTLVRDGNFGVVTSLRGLPLGIRDALPALFGTATLAIAEPGADYQRTDVIVAPGLPIRRMVAAGCTRNDCLLYYERGGFAHTWHVVLFHWTPDATRFVWGGAAPGGLETIEQVRKAILSGAVKPGQRF